MFADDLQSPIDRAMTLDGLDTDPDALAAEIEKHSRITHAFGDKSGSEIDANRAAWLAHRQTGIGGSDAASAVGLSPYKTGYQLYLEKRGEAQAEDLAGNSSVEWGTRLEDVIADAYAEKTQQKVHRVNQMLRHPEHRYMIANLDRRIVGTPHGLEIKTADKWAAIGDEWGPDGTDKVPMHYIIQVQHYMAVTGYKRFDVAALIGGNDLRIYHIPRDESLIEMLIKLEGDFWRGVQDGIPPMAATYEEATKKFPMQRIGSEIEATDDIRALVVRLAQRKADEKAIKHEISRIQASIGEFFGDHEALYYQRQRIATWKEQSTGVQLDSKRLREDHPEIAGNYEYEGTTRVMRLDNKFLKSFGIKGEDA